MTALQDHQWFHRMRGHSLVERPATQADGYPITHTVVGGGFIVPIYLTECSCGRIWT